jgi:hypothetical protein
MLPELFVFIPELFYFKSGSLSDSAQLNMMFANFRRPLLVRASPLPSESNIFISSTYIHGNNDIIINYNINIIIVLII